MDSITHTLFGLAIYGGVDKREMSKPMKRATLITAVVGSHIPDIEDHLFLSKNKADSLFSSLPLFTSGEEARVSFLFIHTAYLDKSN